MLSILLFDDHDMVQWWDIVPPEALQMTRPLSIYPSQGYLFALPNVADPLILGPWIVNIPYIDNFNNLQFRQVNTANLYDDNVGGFGGVCHSLENFLEVAWRAVKQEWFDKNIIQQPPVVDSALLLPGYNRFAVDNIIGIECFILQAWKGTDYWYKSNNFAKYGFVTFGNLSLLPSSQQWWNFPEQSFMSSNGPSGEAQVFLNGPDSVGLCTVYQRADPPDITFTGYLGINGSYNDKGAQYS